MDDTIIHSLEKLFYKKIMLYNDLLHYFNKEKESLINIDLDKLWSISKEKEETCSEIKSIRQKILSLIANPGIDQNSFNFNHILDLIPRENRAKFHKLHRTLIKLKGEVELLRKENMSYINDSLQFLDEILSILTGETKSEMMYNDKCHLRKSGPNIFLSREA